MPNVRPPWKALLAGAAALGAILVVRQATSRAVSSTPEAPRDRPELRPQRVALIGDSYAVGLGPELRGYFPAFRHEGRVGISTRGWAACASCGDWLAEFRPDLVLVVLGVNDGSVPDMASYQTVVREIHGLGARAVWIEPPEGVHAPAARRAIASLGIQTVPATRTPLAADGLHPRDYSAWAREVAAHA